MKSYPGYLFDLDGTLVDTAPDINAALNHALAGQGLATVSEALTRHWVGFGAKAVVEQALNRQASARAADGALVETLLDVFIGYYRRHIAVRSRPYPGVERALERLRERDARLAVVTNKRTDLSEPLLAALDLNRYFDVVVCGDTAAAPKPAADPALFACSALSLAPAESLFVGDSETDVSCARAAGCPVVVVRDGYNHGVPAAELGADAVIESFSDLV